MVSAKEKIIKQQSSEVMSGAVILGKVVRVGFAVKSQHHYHHCFRLI